MGRLEEELEIAALVEQLEELRPAVDGRKKRTDEDMRKRRELVDQLAALNVEFKTKYRPSSAAPEDGIATPEAVAATIKGSDSE